MTMKRRNFLTMLGAAASVPLMPAPALTAAPAVAVSYNRYQYGLAVFHARTRSSLGVADLMSRLNVSGATAQAMMVEMKASGVIAPVVNSAVGAMRAITSNQTDPRSVAERLAEKAGQMLRDPLPDVSAEDDVPEDINDIDRVSDEEAQEARNEKV